MTPSGAVAETRKPGATVFHRLMMPAVHFARVGVAQALAHQPRQQRVLVDPDFVRELERLMRRHRQAVLERAGAPATGCPAPACRRRRRSAPGCRGRSRGSADRAARAAAISAISNSSRAGSTSTIVGCGCFAVARRRDVVAAGQQQPVDARRAPRRPASTRRGCATSPPTWRIACR